MTLERHVTHRYEDPIDVVWVACAARLGYRIERGDDVYAGFDGAGTITVATGAELDPDDSLAQIVLHELCHALVASDTARRQPDWGLDNTGERDLVAELACHRLQAALADRHGLRAFMASTTEWRPHWDALPADPLAGDHDPAIALARAGWTRSRQSPWRDALDDALAATAAIAAAVSSAAQHTSLWSTYKPLHPLGSRVGPRDAQCSNCAWRFRAGPGYPVDRCRQHRPPGAAVAPRVDPDWPACERYEPPLTDASCATCGACCRQAFHLVPVGVRAPLAKARPEWVIRDAHGAHLPRPDGYCVALERGPGGGLPEAPYRCSAYDLRPRSCRDFTVGEDACLLARQRVGLSATAPLSATTSGA